MSNISVRVYTREPVEGKYPNGLSYSVHLSFVKEGKETPLHNNYGLLFPKAGVNADNVIVPVFLGEARIAGVQIEGKYKYIITGTDLLSTGEENAETKGCFWSFCTEDFLTFEEWGLLEEGELRQRTGRAVNCLRESDFVTISAQMAEAMLREWNPLQFREILTTPKEREKTGKISVLYSDGSIHEKMVQDIPSLQYPLAKGFGDPVVLLWKDEYYFIATNDNVNDIGLYVRKAHNLEDLFADDVKMHIILDRDEKRELIQTFWAPEFHIIGGELYVLFAVSGQQWGPQCHLMKLKENGDILKAEDWEDPVRIRRADGGFLGQNGITLDMTYVRSGMRHYYVWSYREHIGSPLDTGSMLMVAEFSEQCPEQIITEPVCLSRPLYGFENTCGTINNEGPYAFYHNGTIYLSYSGGDARGYLYSIGMLTAKDGADLCNLSVWEKAKTPVLSFASVPGEYGPGHNSFFCDRNGDWWIAYHATPSYGDRGISSAIRRVHFDRNGKPRFDLAREEDLPEQYR